MPRVAERRRTPRHRLAQGRAGHAPSAVGDRASPRTVRRRRRQAAATARSPSRRRRSARRRTGGARPGAARRAPRRRARPRRRSRSRITVAGGGRGRRRRGAEAHGRRGRRRSSRVVRRLQDLLPRRRTVLPPGARRSTTAREMQRRAAVALLAFVVVAGGLAAGVCAFGGQPTEAAIARSTPGPGRSTTPQATVAGYRARASTSSPTIRGRPLDAPDRRVRQLDEAEHGGRAGRDDRRRCARRPSPGSTGCTRSCRSARPRVRVQAEGGAAAERPAAVVAWLRRGAVRPRRRHQDRLPHRPQAKKATPIMRRRPEGRGVPGSADPKLLTTGGARRPDARREEQPVALAAVEHRGQGHRASGSGIARLGASGATTSLGIGDVRRELRRSALQAVPRRPVARSRSWSTRPPGRRRLPGRAHRPAAAPRARSTSMITTCYIDGDIYAVENGSARAGHPGARAGTPARRPMTLLRGRRRTRLMTSGSGPPPGSDLRVRPGERPGRGHRQDQGHLRRAVPARRRHDPAWGDLRDLLVLPAQAADAPATLWWLSARGLHQVLLEAVPATSRTTPASPLAVGARRRPPAPRSAKPAAAP